MTRFILALILAFGFANSYAAPTKKAKNKAKQTVSIPDDFEMNFEMANNDYYSKHYAAAIKDGSRKISQSVSDVPAIEKTFSADFIEMRKALIGDGEKDLGVRTPEQLDDLIRKYQKPDVYNSLSPQAKMVAVQLQSLQPYKSFFYRAQKYFGKGTAVRSMIVTMLRNSTTAIQTFFPADGTTQVNHWDVIFKYMVQPMQDMGPAIDEDHELHAFVVDLVRVNGALLNKMHSIYTSTDHIWWDNKLYMSFANFTSEKDRYVKLGKPEMETMLAGAFAGYSALAATSAYSFTGLADAIVDTSKFFGVDTAIGALRGNVFGLTSADRFKVLRKYNDLFVLVPGGEKAMANAYNSMLSSVRYSKTAWVNLRSAKASDRQSFLFDPQAVVPFNRILGTNFESIETLLEGKNVASTSVQGELIRANLRDFYMNPPKNLHHFYPVAFDTKSPDYLKKTVENMDGTSQLVPYRNYSRGMATSWSAHELKRIFPDIKVGKCPSQLAAPAVECTDDVRNYARILSQTWGGVGFGSLISAMVF